METATRVVLPAALSGVIASIILGFSRAVGETMIVAIAAGQNTVLSFNPLDAVQTMTAFIVQISLGDTPTGSLAFKTLFAVAMLLFLMTLVMNLIAAFVTKRYRRPTSDWLRRRRSRDLWQPRLRRRRWLGRCLCSSAWRRPPWGWCSWAPDYRCGPRRRGAPLRLPDHPAHRLPQRLSLALSGAGGGEGGGDRQRSI